MRRSLAGLALLVLPSALAAQAAGKFPPDSLIDVEAIGKQP